MSNLLQEALGFVVELCVSLAGFVALVLGFVFDSLVIMYTDMPLTLGIAIGVLATWVMHRRDKHPVLKVLSAPLKLVLDTLDLVWDQVTEAVMDAWEMGMSWIKKPFSWSKEQLKKGWDLVVKGFSLLKVKITRKKD